MTGGTIKIADHNGVYVIKMEGDVRLTLCLSFDSFISEMFNSSNFLSVVFDLTEALNVDSTTLGLMAKISILGKDFGMEHPLVVINSPSIKRLLVSMGFEDIFKIVDHANIEMTNERELSENTECEDDVKEKILEAHRVLMELNESNRDTFQELVDSLEGL